MHELDAVSAGIRWNASYRAPLKYTKDTCIHVCIEDTLLCPKYAFAIEIHPCNEDTSSYRTLYQFLKVSTIEGCIIV